MKAGLDRLEAMVRAGGRAPAPRSPEEAGRRV